LVPEEGGDPVAPHDVYVSGMAIQIPKWQGWAKSAKKRLERLMEKIPA
jgi:putative transposase